MIYLHGCGQYHPENVIDNRFLEELDIGTNEKWILDRVGIRTRRTVLPLGYIIETKNKNLFEANEAALFTNAQTGAFAAVKAIEMAAISSGDIGMVVAGGCSPQTICPSESNTIAAQLEIEVPCFDLSSSCSTLMSQLNFINGMCEDYLPDYILLVIPENNTRRVDYSDRSSAVLWGDCSTAFVVSTKIKSPFRITNTFIESSPSGHSKVEFPLSGHFRQDGRTVQTFAIKKSVSSIKKLKSKLDDDNCSLKFIGHQANLMMLDSVRRIAGIDEANHYYNVDRFGNCGASGAGSVLVENIGQLKTGDTVVMTVVGAGLTWGGAILEVGEIR